MQVIVSASVVQSVVGTPAASKLHTLLGHAYRGRHIISFDPPDCIVTWLQTIDSGARDAYQDAIDLGNRAGRDVANDAATIKIEQNVPISWADPVAILPLAIALQVLAEKLGFLLENGENDWNFLLGIMPQSQRERIQKAFDEGWLEPLHGGGTTIVAQLHARLAQPHRGLRTAMMFDSDRRHPLELTATWQPSDILHGPQKCDAYEWEVLAKQKIPNRYWRLQRRFIESYMPDDQLRTVVEGDKATALDAFLRMSPEQRWFYNMKQGFARDRKSEAIDQSDTAIRIEAAEMRQRDLYCNIGEIDKTALESGLGKHLGQHYAKALTSNFEWDDAARNEAQIHLPKFLRLL